MKAKSAIFFIVICLFSWGCQADKVPDANKEPQVQYKMVPAQGHENG